MSRRGNNKNKNHHHHEVISILDDVDSLDDPLEVEAALGVALGVAVGAGSLGTEAGSDLTVASASSVVDLTTDNTYANSNANTNTNANNIDNHLNGKRKRRQTSSTSLIPVLDEWKILCPLSNQNANTYSNRSTNNTSTSSTNNRNDVNFATNKFQIQGIVRNHKTIPNGSSITIQKAKLYSTTNSAIDDHTHTHTHTHTHPVNDTYINSSHSSSKTMMGDESKEELHSGDVIIAMRTRIQFQLGTKHNDEKKKRTHTITNVNSSASNNVGDGDSDYGIIDETMTATSSTAVRTNINDNNNNNDDNDIIYIQSPHKLYNTNQINKKQHQQQEQQYNNTKVTPIARILEVFPDMHIDHIRQHLLQAGISKDHLTLPIIDSSLSRVSKPNINNATIIGERGGGGRIEEVAIRHTLEILACQASYPKSKKSTSLNANIINVEQQGVNNNMNPNINTMTSATTTTSTTITYYHDYSSSSTTYDRSTQYKQQVHTHLYSIFPFLSSIGLKYLLNMFENRYYLTFSYIIDKLKLGCKEAIQSGNAIKMSTSISALASASSSASILMDTKQWDQDEIEEYQYNNLRKLSLGCRLLPEQMKALEIKTSKDTLTTTAAAQTTARGRKKERNERSNIVKTTLTKPRKPFQLVGTTHKSQLQQQLLHITDNTLKNEVQYAINRHEEWETNIQNKLNRKKLRHQSEIDGTAIECNCCYVDCAFEEMVHCVEEGHLFCIDCVRRHAEEQIFGCGKLGNGNGGKDNGNFGELGCMDVNGCTGHFARSALTKALPTKVMQKYDELQATQVLEKAGMKDLCKCPKCDFQAIVPETELIFCCPVTTCQYESCRKCGEEAHIPLRCSEVEKKDETSARVRVEEAMTMARVRHCPNGCKQSFYKVEGCNKMTCPTCKSYICYVCRQIIPKNVGYGHFCQIPHCKHTTTSCSKKCALYSNAEEDDKAAAKEAGLKTMRQIQMEEEEKSGGGRTKHIDINGILKSPPSTSTKVGPTTGQLRHQVVPPVGIRRHHQHVQGMAIHPQAIRNATARVENINAAMRRNNRRGRGIRRGR